MISNDKPVVNDKDGKYFFFDIEPSDTIHFALNYGGNDGCSDPAYDDIDDSLVIEDPEGNYIYLNGYANNFFLPHLQCIVPYDQHNPDATMIFSIDDLNNAPSGVLADPNKNTIAELPYDNFPPGYYRLTYNRCSLGIDVNKLGNGDIQDCIDQAKKTPSVRSPNINPYLPSRDSGMFGILWEIARVEFQYGTDAKAQEVLDTLRKLCRVKLGHDCKTCS